MPEKTLDELVTSYMEGAGKYLVAHGTAKPTLSDIIALANLRASIKLILFASAQQRDTRSSAGLAQFVADDGKGWGA